MIEKTLSKFDGIYFLRHDKPKCVVMNQKSCSVSFGEFTLPSNPLSHPFFSDSFTRSFVLVIVILALADFSFSLSLLRARTGMFQITGNLETGADRLTRRDRDMIRRASREVRFSLDNPKDLTKRYKTCAIVGNAPSLARDKFGALIDEYDAVFRLNHVQGANPEKKYPKRSGTKTTFRCASHLLTSLSE